MSTSRLSRKLSKLCTAFRQTSFGRVVKLHFKCPESEETFWGDLFLTRNICFCNILWHSAKNFRLSGKSFPAGYSKWVSTCPWEYSEEKFFSLNIFFIEMKINVFSPTSDTEWILLAVCRQVFDLIIKISFKISGTVVKTAFYVNIRRVWWEIIYEKNCSLISFDFWRERSWPSVNIFPADLSKLRSWYP